ncbi:ubiquitin-like-specific protease 2B [Populus alba x Populus x berolinensis]|nr:ubiquitin-like-specific protease 2B [Populus alba x Populus x berolinensis]
MGRTRRTGRKTRPHGGGVVTIDLESGFRNSRFSALYQSICSSFANLWKSFSEDKKMSFAYLDSLWFTMYTDASSGVKVLEWIKRKHIFSKKYVLVPIVRWCHWSLLIFCHFGESLLSENITPCMLLLDSLEMASPKRLEPDIRKCHNREMVVECGNYVLYFINLFVQDAPENFHMEGYPYFMKDNWFSPEGLEHFCEKLESLESDIL